MAWVEQVLVPTLRTGDIAVLDNLSSHKIDGVREAIEAARTVDALWAAIGELAATFQPDECRNDIRNSGYVQLG